MKDIKKALKNGEVVIGTFNLIPHPTVVEIIGYAGFDFLIIDCEAGALSPWGTEMENMIRAAYAADVTPLVRVTQKNTSGMIHKALNSGARGIVIPHVNTREEIATAINAAKYPPEGNRTADPICRAPKYGATTWSDFVRTANEEVMVIPLLEEKAAMDNMEDILSVNGLDMVLFGPFDLALRLGGVGDPKAEAQVSEYEEKLISLCNERGIFVMSFGWDADSVKRSISNGCRAIAYSADISRLNQALWRDVEDLKNKIPGCLLSKRGE